MNKAESAAIFVDKLNPDVTVRTYSFKITTENVRGVIRDYDIVVDCTDTFHTRFLLNDACILESRPLVHAAVLKFEGQIMTIKPLESACYRCFFARSSSTWDCPNLQRSGNNRGYNRFFGVLQANEVIKLLTGKGKIFTNRLLYVDLLYTDFNLTELKKISSCLLVVMRELQN